MDLQVWYHWIHLVSLCILKRHPKTPRDIQETFTHQNILENERKNWNTFTLRFQNLLQNQCNWDNVERALGDRMHQWNKIINQERICDIYSQLTLNKSNTKIRNESSQWSMLESLGTYVQKNVSGFRPYIIYISIHSGSQTKCWRPNYKTHKINCKINNVFYSVMQSLLR